MLNYILSLFKKACINVEFRRVNYNDIDIYYKLFPKKSVDERRFYNIGAGDFSHPAWTNVDKLSDWYKQNDANTKRGINFDLFDIKLFPMNDNSAEIIYSSHTIEHITDQAAMNMLQESFRILKPGGILRLTAPNIDLHYAAYKNNDRSFFSWIDKIDNPEYLARFKFRVPPKNLSIEQLFLMQFATSVSTIHSDGAPFRFDDRDVNQIFSTMKYEDALNYCTSHCPLEIQKKYPGNHMNWWNYQKVIDALHKAGFGSVRISGRGQSICPVLRNECYFDSTMPLISFYVETIKQ